jgi:hypothetical protein
MSKEVEMREIGAILEYIYILLMVVWVSISCVSAARAATAAIARRRFDGLLITIYLAIAFSLTPLSRPDSVLFGVVYTFLGLSYGFVLSDLLFIRPSLRRRVIPPCVSVRARPQRLWLIGLLALALVVQVVGIMVVDSLEPGRSMSGLRRVAIPVTMYLVSLAGFFIGTVCQAAEICTNGVWYNGTLHEWSSFERFAWSEQGDKTVVELVYSKEFQTPFLLSQRISVPPQNRDAAKQLLEANLTNSAPEAAKA